MSSPHYVRESPLAASCRADGARRDRRPERLPASATAGTEQNGIDISHMQRVIEPTKRLNDECRRRGVPIVWTRHGTKGLEDGGPFMEIREILRDGGLRQEHVGVRDPRGARCLARRTGTSRRRACRRSSRRTSSSSCAGLDAETVLITGVLTNQCVGATTKDALFRDFKPIVDRGVHRDDSPAPARAGDRDDQRRLGSGELARARRSPSSRAFPAVLATA